MGMTLWSLKSYRSNCSKTKSYQIQSGSYLLFLFLAIRPRHWAQPSGFQICPDNSWVFHHRVPRHLSRCRIRSSNITRGFRFYSYYVTVIDGHETKEDIKETEEKNRVSRWRLVRFSSIQYRKANSQSIEVCGLLY